MDQEWAEVIVNGVRCQVVRMENERLLVQPISTQGFGINVTRWVAVADAEPVPEQARPVVALSQDEIRQLAAVLRQVFYEGSEPPAVPQRVPTP